MNNQPQDSDNSPVDFPQYLGEATEIWDDIAEWWDDTIGDGNDAQNYLIEPTQERLLDIKRGDRVLDIACGAGRFTRRMADAGAQVVAIDHSRKFIERAQRRAKDYADRIQFQVANAADRDALNELPNAPYDAAVCTMGIMDMAVISPLAEALPKLLKPHGKFVFSLLHPVFNSDRSRTSLEREFTEHGVIQQYRVSVPNYLRSRAYLGIGVVGQPRPHRYFHRPVNELLRVFLEQGFTLTAYEEPRYPAHARKDTKSPLSTSFFQEFPLVLVVRLELAG